MLCCQIQWQRLQEQAMKISRKKVEIQWSCVGAYVPGTPVEMKSPVNQFCKVDDLYIIGEIPCCYLRDAKGPGYTSWILEDKIAVTNLRSGGVSLVQKGRPCRYIESAKVVT